MLAARLGLMAAAVTAVLMVRPLLRAARSFDYRGKVVLIAGGSRGLGLVMARQLASQGTKVALIARNEDKLREAAQQLRAMQADAYFYACDIRDQAQVQQAVEAVVANLGPIDVLINDAGVIQVGPIDTMTLDDYKEAMEVHFWGPLYLTMAAMPHMRERKFGRIANITSIGGKVSVPHLLPYCASKFALVGWSEGLRAELLKDNVLVTTVCPGMMRTGSHVNAYFKGNNEGEFAWFSIGNGLPITSVSAEKAARQVIEAVRRGDPELIISVQAQAAIKFAQLFPGLTHDLFGVANTMLPKATSDQTERHLGKESKSWMSPSFLTKLADDQIPRNNES